MEPSAARSPSLSSTTGSTRSTLFPPLSHHGMPKTPSPLSSGGSLRRHRFSGIGLPSSPRPSEPMSPMSPPMSAKSFGTFIDSEPSTPAYSPRMGSTWDGSTLVLLSPVSSASSSPMEPVWEMMTPLQKPPKKSLRHRTKPSSVKPVSANSAPSAHPVEPVQPEVQKKNEAPAEEETEQQATEETAAQAAPLEKLATRMKSLLRRKMSSDKKTEKRRKGYYDLDRIEDVHWTEM